MAGPSGSVASFAPSGSVASFPNEDAVDAISLISVTGSRGQASLHTGIYDRHVIVMGLQLLGLDTRSAMRRATESDISDEGVFKYGVGWSKADILKLNKAGVATMPSEDRIDGCW